MITEIVAYNWFMTAYPYIIAFVIGFALSRIKLVIYGLSWMWIMLCATFANGPVRWSGIMVDGFGLRKFAAGLAIGAAIYLTTKLATDKNVEFLFTSWLVYSAVCIGLVTIPDLLKALASIKNQPVQQDIVDKPIQP